MLPRVTVSDSRWPKYSGTKKFNSFHSPHKLTVLLLQFVFKINFKKNKKNKLTVRCNSGVSSTGQPSNSPACVLKWAPLVHVGQFLEKFQGSSLNRCSLPRQSTLQPPSYKIIFIRIWFIEVWAHTVCDHLLHSLIKEQCFFLHYL